jgi:hypothetical protein
VWEGFCSILSVTKYLNDLICWELLTKATYSSLSHWEIHERCHRSFGGIRIFFLLCLFLLMSFVIPALRLPFLNWLWTACFLLGWFLWRKTTAYYIMASGLLQVYNNNKFKNTSFSPPLSLASDSSSPESSVGDPLSSLSATKSSS